MRSHRRPTTTRRGARQTSRSRPWHRTTRSDAPLRARRGVFEVDARGLEPVADRVGARRSPSRRGRRRARSSSPATRASTAAVSLASALPAARQRRVVRVQPEHVEHRRPPRRRCHAAHQWHRSPSSLLPSRTTSWIAATAAGVPRSSSIAATNVGARRARRSAPRRATAARALEEALDPAEADRRPRRAPRRRTRRASGSAPPRGSTAARSPRTRSSTDGDQQRVAERLAHLLAGGGDPGVVHPVRRERVPGRAATGPARSRGAGSAGRRRRRGCRRRGRGTCRPSRSTRCASRGGPGPTATARRRSPARTPSSSPSRARSRGGRACRAGRRPRRPPCRRCFWWVSSPYAGQERTSK